MAKFNPFSSVTKEEQEAKEKSILESLRKMKELKDAARACLKLDEFKIYQERVSIAEAVLVGVMLKIDMFDPKELWRLQALQSELRAIRSILSIEKDAK